MIRSRRALLAGLIAVAPAAYTSNRAEIRDRHGRLIGVILTRSESLREARAPNGRLLGTYSAKRNETRDPMGRLVTKGDSLSALILRATP